MTTSSPVIMYSWGSIWPTPLRNAGDIARAFLALGISDLRQAAYWVQSLPYGRNSRPENPLVVLEEKRGTCSTKHALMKRLAVEQSVPMELTVGIYEMSDKNTPGVGEVLKQFGLISLPEAHCYLWLRGKRIDLTGLRDQQGREPIQNFLVEETIEPDEITDYKIWLHKCVLRSWSARQRHMRHSIQNLWCIREECILALSNRDCPCANHSRN